MPHGLRLGKPKVLYFGELLKYLYTSGTKSYGAYNGTLPEKYFYKPSIKLPFTPAWTLEDMIAAAKKQGITIAYTTVYKTLSVQEQEFKTKNSKTPTNVSKASSIPEVKNGRTYAGVKWYPTTITSYNPLPGFNVFGTALCIRITNNNDKIINFIKTNGANYGWSWCSDIPTSDPDFQNILVYYAAGEKPNKYRDRSMQEIDGFKPAPGPKGAPGPGQKQVWVPDESATKINPETGKVTSNQQDVPGHWENIPIPIIKTTTVTPVKPIGNSVWDENIVPKINGPTILVVNSTNLVGYAGRLASTLNYIGLKGPEIITKKTINRYIPGIGNTPNVGIYTGIEEYFTYIWGVRREILNKSKTALIPEFIESAVNSHEQTPGNRTHEELKNVNAVNHIDLMSFRKIR